MRFVTPLRYPGGKGKLTPFIKRIFEENDLLDGIYAEPYAGGAGIAMSLLLSNYVSRVYLNDLNPSVYAFWESAFDQTEELCSRISSAKLNMDEWRAQRAVQLDPDNHTSLELGFSTFYLNRTNRSGIIKGGVIGGKNQDGKWKIDARFNKSELITRIERLAMYGSRVALSQLDAADFIKDILPEVSMHGLVYLDPPYYVKGAGLYENHYFHEDHAKIAQLVKGSIKQPWIVSYDFNDEINDMYPWAQSLRYDISYSAQGRYRGRESMFFSDALSVPELCGPIYQFAA